MIRSVYSSFRRVGPIRLIPAAVIGIVITAAVLAFNGSLTMLYSAPPKNTAKVAFNGRAQSPDIKAIRFVISRHGVEPAELTISAGRYFVAVDNALDSNEMDLDIDRVNGPRVKNGKTRKGQLKFRDFVDFTPGQYILTEKKNPGITSRIIVIDTQ
jgi:hypothetical protein